MRDVLLLLLLLAQLLIHGEQHLSPSQSPSWLASPRSLAYRGKLSLSVCVARETFATYSSALRSYTEPRNSPGRSNSAAADTSTQVYVTLYSCR